MSGATEDRNLHKDPEAAKTNDDLLNRILILHKVCFSYIFYFS